MASRISGTMPKYNTSQISAALDQVLSEIGADRFSSMRLLELEKLVRTNDREGRLPGKTLLRATIHSYRSAKWPGTGPKPAASRRYW